MLESFEENLTKSAIYLHLYDESLPQLARDHQHLLLLALLNVCPLVVPFSSTHTAFACNYVHEVAGCFHKREVKQQVYLWVKCRF